MIEDENLHSGWVRDASKSLRRPDMLILGIIEFGVFNQAVFVCFVKVLIRIKLASNRPNVVNRSN